MDYFAEEQIRTCGTVQRRHATLSPEAVAVTVRPLASEPTRAILEDLKLGAFAAQPERALADALAAGARALRASVCGRSAARRGADTCRRAARAAAPVFEWAPALTLRSVRADLLAGFTVGVMAVPQAMSYASIAGLRFESGLYAAVAPAAIYALLGHSRQLAVGPVAMVSLLIAAGAEGRLTVDECPAAFDGSGGGRPQHELCPEAYAQFVANAALASALLQLGAGALNLGYLVSFLAHPVVSGFTSAAAVTIGVTELKAWVGYSLGASPLLHVTLRTLLAKLPETNVVTLALGLASYAFLAFTKALAARFERLAPLRALGPLLLCAASIALVAAAPALAARWRVRTVGALPSGLPPWTGGALSLDRVRRALPAAASAAFIGFMESVAIAKSLAAQHNHPLPVGRELVAIGIANAAAACTGGYPVAGSFSRSAVANATGARSQLAGLVTACAVLLALVALTPAFELLPHFALGAIVISSVAALIAWRELPHLWAVKRADGALWLLAFCTTLLLGVEHGILISVGASLALIVHESLRPQVAVLWRMRASPTVYRPVKQEPDGQFVHGVLLVRIGGPLYFANVAYVREKLVALLGAFARHEAVRYLVVEMTPVSSLDSTALLALGALLTHLRERGVSLALATVSSRAERTLRVAGLYDELGGAEWVRPNVHAAVVHCLRHAACVERDGDARAPSSWPAQPVPLALAPRACAAAASGSVTAASPSPHAHSSFFTRGASRSSSSAHDARDAAVRAQPSGSASCSGGWAVARGAAPAEADRRASTDGVDGAEWGSPPQSPASSAASDEAPLNCLPAATRSRGTPLAASDSAREAAVALRAAAERATGAAQLGHGSGVALVTSVYASGGEWAEGGVDAPPGAQADPRAHPNDEAGANGRSSLQASRSDAGSCRFGGVDEGGRGGRVWRAPWRASPLGRHAAGHSPLDSV